MEWMASIVVGLFALCGTIISNLVNSSKTQWRIEQLERKQDTHNSVIERVLVLEQSHKSQWKSIEDINSQLKEIKREVYGHE